MRGKPSLDDELADHAAGVAHIPATPEHLDEAPYMGAAFAAFVLVAFVAAPVVVARDDRRVYGFVIALGAVAVATYAATRLVSGRSASR